MPDGPSEGEDGGFGERLLDAAIEAELETGEREPTREAARANVLVRLARMSVGFVLLLVGIILIPLPGPGWLIVAVALGILARDVAWADRLLSHVRRRIPGAENPSPRAIILTVGVALLGSAIALGWTFAR